MANQDETNNGKHCHEDARTFTQSKCIQLNEGLRCIKGEQCLKVGGAEQEQDRSGEPQGPGRHDTRYDAFTRNNSIF